MRGVGEGCPFRFLGLAVIPAYTGMTTNKEKNHYQLSIKNGIFANQIRIDR
jgi:hypothetical protein